jgi:hypothetical protein
VTTDQVIIIVAIVTVIVVLATVGVRRSRVTQIERKPPPVRDPDA